MKKRDEEDKRKVRLVGLEIDICQTSQYFHENIKTTKFTTFQLDAESDES